MYVPVSLCVRARVGVCVCVCACMSETEVSCSTATLALPARDSTRVADVNVFTVGFFYRRLSEDVFC